MASNKSATTGINTPAAKKGSGTFVTQQGKQGTKGGVDDVAKARSPVSRGSAALGVTANKVPESSNPHLKNFDRLLQQTPGSDFRPAGAGATQSRTDHNGNGISG